MQTRNREGKPPRADGEKKAGVWLDKSLTKMLDTALHKTLPFR